MFPHALPLELHKVIINFVGQELLQAPEGSECESKTADSLGTLCQFSLVCKEWHSLSIRHIFRHLNMDPEWNNPKTRKKNGNSSRLDCLLPLLQANSDIARWVETVVLKVPFAAPVSLAEDGLVEQICQAIAPVKSLKINFQHLFPGGDYTLKERPHLLKAVRSLTVTPHLRRLELQSAGAFHTSILEDIPNLEALALDHFCASRVVVDHRPERLTFLGDATVPSTFRKLSVASDTAIIAQAVTDPNFRTLISGIQDLDTVVQLSRPFQWDMVINLSSITTLSLRCYMWNGWGGRSLASFHNDIPWDSFNHLDSLLLVISAEYTRRLRPDDPDDAFDLLLSGPSRLPHLSSLQVNFKITATAQEMEEIHPVVKMLYPRVFNRTFADPQSFPTLRTFGTEMELATPIYDWFTKKKTIQLVKEELPSVFGSGGREETHGWMATVEARLLDYDDPNDLYEPDEWHGAEEDESDEMDDMSDSGYWY